MDYIKKNSKVSKKTLPHSNGSSNLNQLDDDVRSSNTKERIVGYEIQDKGKEKYFFE